NVITFLSNAIDSDQNKWPKEWQVYTSEVNSGTIEMIDVPEVDYVGSDLIYRPSLSTDGNVVGFTHSGTVYVYNRQDETYEKVGLSSDKRVTAKGWNVSLRGDGQAI